MRRIHFNICFWFFLARISFVEADSLDLERALGQAVSGENEKFQEAQAIFEALQKQGPPSPEAFYLIGFACMRLHLPAKAEAFLRRAKEQKFTGFEGWTSVDVLLRRVEQVSKLSPPLLDPKFNGPIAVYASGITEWNKPVLTAIPDFIKVGHNIFGDALPSLHFYLFSDRPTYVQFYSAMFESEISTWWQDGTGSMNIATYCERDKDGRISRRVGDPETVGSVLHELGHAWCSSYLMNYHNQNYHRICPPWLDEGLAEYVASLWDRNYLTRRQRWLRQKVKNSSLPSFEELQNSTNFFGAEADLRYWLSACLVDRLLGSDARLIPKVLDALAEKRNGDSAIRAVTQKDPATKYKELVDFLLKK